MKHLFTAIIIIALLVAFGGCRRAQTLEPYGWRALGGEFDSLTLRLEKQVWGYAQVESIKLNIDRLESAARLDTTESRAKRARIQYWRARLYYASSLNDSAALEAKKGLAIVDTIADYYDYMRLSEESLNDHETEHGLENYAVLSKKIDYARSIGDPILLSNTLRIMGNLVSSLDIYAEALQYFREADSLAESMGFDLVRKKNQINVASVYMKMGDSARSIELLKSLERDSGVMTDPQSRNLVFRNIFAFTHDYKYLRKTYQDIVNNVSRRRLRGFYAAAIADYMYEHGQYDSAAVYSALAMKDLPAITDDKHRALVFGVQSEVFARKQQFDSALYYQVEYENALTRYREEADHLGVMRLKSRHALDEERMRYESRLSRRNIALGALGLVLVLGVVILAGWIKRRRLQQAMRQLQSDLELERARNTIAASSLSITEKDNILHTLQSELGRMRRLGAISAHDANSLESTIKSHLGENESQEMFRQMFDTVNPEFSRRLRELCPDMAENTVMIASYIVMGLDSKRIARLLFIKQTSVFQARWRLRRRLNVPAGTSLRAALQDLNTRRLSPGV